MFLPVTHELAPIFPQNVNCYK